MKLVDLLDELPGGPVVHAGDTTVDRQELLAEVDAVAAALRGTGVRPGDAVAVRLPNTPVVIAALFGVWRAGAVYVPFNPRSPVEEIRANLASIGPAAVITTPGALAGFGDHRRGAVHRGQGWAVHAIPEAERRGGGWPGGGLPLAARSEARTASGKPEGMDPPPEADDRSDGVALIQFTSGTTGRPKPVPLADATVLDLLDKVLASIRRGGGAQRPAKKPMTNLIPVPLSLWAGIYQVLFAFRVGAPVVLMDHFETIEFARLVAEHGIRSTVLPPAAMTMLADDPRVTDLSPLRMVRSITAPLSPVQARRFRDRFGVMVLNSYGQTELGGEVVGWSAADARDHGEDKLGSVGRPHPGVQVRTVGDDGAPTGAGEGGELFVQTPATKAGRIPADFADRLTEDGWFRTGDIGRVDADGFVWLEGRVSDLINRGGLKVFPAQVEEVLAAAPGVREAAVVGVPDDRVGEVPWAFVVADGPALDPDALGSWCRQRLVAYRVPARFVVVDALPRNEAGKVLKTELTARVGSAEPSPS